MSEPDNILHRYKDQRILIAPLNWGLGHASRCLPLIKHLAVHNHIIVASDGLALTWLRKEIGDSIQLYELPVYDIEYDHVSSWLSFFKYGPRIRSAIINEYHATASLIAEHKIDLIISDHRLGVRSQKIESIIVAHQLTIPHKNKILSTMATKIQLHFINQFDQCWIPDHQAVESRLSGQLSDLQLSIDKHYIGPLSHMTICSDAHGALSLEPMYDVAVVLSGIEPTRTHLENKLICLLSQMKGLRIVWIRGTTVKPSDFFSQSAKEMECYDLLDSTSLSRLICMSQVVIARSGYSTIMDLHHLTKKALLIPTPHQPEQQYLALVHNNRADTISIVEEHLNSEMLRSALNQLLELSK